MNRPTTDRLTAMQVFEYRSLLLAHGGTCRCDGCNYARGQLIAREPEPDSSDPTHQPEST